MAEGHTKVSPKRVLKPNGPPPGGWGRARLHCVSGKTQAAILKGEEDIQIDLSIIASSPLQRAADAGRADHGSPINPGMTMTA